MFHEESQSKTGGITLSPKASFLLGLAGGVLILCTVGFFILLAFVLKGNVTLSAAKAAGGDSLAAAQAPAPAPSAAPSAAPDPVGTVKEVTAADHIRGDKNAEVTLVEWSDFQCPFCQRFHPSMEQLMTEYKGKVRWVFRHFPLSFHPNATPSANAAECASEQGKFWEFADSLFSNQDRLGTALYEELAGKLGLNKAKFNDCIKTNKYQSRVSSDESAGTAAGITGTPGTVIIAKDGSKQLVPGAVPYEQLKQMVDAALK